MDVVSGILGGWFWDNGCKKRGEGVLRRWMMQAAVVGFGVMLLTGPALVAEASQAINVGGRKQLFIDHRFIESPEGIALQPHSADKAEVVLRAVDPDEQWMLWVSSVLEVDGRFYMFYGTRFNASKVEGEKEIWQVMRLATSSDGLTWQRVSVNRFDIGYGLENNIVMVGSWGTVFIDPNETDGYRFYMLGHLKSNKWWSETQFVPTVAKDQKNKKGKLYLCRSKDGVVWEAVKEPVFPFTGDTRYQSLYDPRIKKYVCYLRSRPGGHGSRSVARGESDHLIGAWPYEPDPYMHRRGAGQRDWLMTELPLVMQPDEMDPPLFGIYTPNVNVYPWAEDAYIAFPDEYRRRDGIPSYGRDKRGKPGNEGPLTPGLAVSRDGIGWHRFHTSYVPLGRKGQIDSGTVYMGVGMIRHADELWQYCTVSPHTHHGFGVSLPGMDGGIRRVVQRLDGFVSADAGLERGSFRTPAIVFEGNRLELNVDCGSRGEVWVEIQDEKGVPIPGYTLDDAVSTDLNGVAEEVWWKGGADVGALAGRPVRLRFVMRSACLYAFQFVEK